MKIKRIRHSSTVESPLLELTAFEAFAQRKAIEQKIAKLQQQSKALKAIVESEFRANQVRLVSDDGSLTLERSTKTVAPFQNPGYSYHVYSLTAKGEGASKKS